MTVLDLHPYALVAIFLCFCDILYFSLNQTQEKDLLDALVKLSAISYDGKSLRIILLV